MGSVARPLRSLLLAFGVAVVLLAPAPAAFASAPPQPTPPTTGFLSGTVDVGRCISALPRPECDTEHKGDWHFYLVVSVLTAGLTFIGWRIVRGVRARDRLLDGERR